MLKLSDAISELLETQIQPKQKKFSRLIESWDELLPPELVDHCRPVEIAAGRLKVMVDSPLYKYQLQIHCRSLIKQIRQACPRAQIRQIKIVLG